MINKEYGAIQQITLPELFENKSFKIPDYQRGYSWGNEQRNDFINDLKDIEGEDYKHYMGTIVAVKKDGDDNSYDLVDGQQRLTTIIIFLSAIYHSERLSESEKRGVADNYLKKEREGGSIEYRFHSNQQLDVIKRIIGGDKLDKNNFPLRQDRNVIEAYEQFSDVLGEEDVKPPLDYLKVLQENIGFILFVPAHKGVVGRMFEVINNRGKPLSQLEKIKNYLIYYAEQSKDDNLKEEVTGRWRTLLENIQLAGYESSEQENEFLRICWIVFGSKSKKESYNIYKSLKEHVESSSEKSRFLLDFYHFIVNASEVFKVIFTSKETLGEVNDLYCVYEKIVLQPNLLGILPLVLAVELKQGNKEQNLKILILLEKLNFRYYVCQVSNRNDTRHAELFALASKYYHEKIDINDLSEKLICFINDNTKDKDFLESLTNELSPNSSANNFYKWHGLKYFLARFEVSLIASKKSKMLSNYLSKRSIEKDDHLEKEHIFAEKNNLEGVKNKLLPLLEYNRVRIGNFTLLTRSQNAAANNSPVEQKLKELSKNDIKLHALRFIVDSYDNINGDVEKKYHGKRYHKANRSIEKITCLFDKIEERYLNFALSEWSINDEKIRVEVSSFKNQECKEIKTGYCWDLRAHDAASEL